MNWQIFTQERHYIKYFKLIAVLSIFFTSLSLQAEWKVDFSRRMNELRKPASAEKPLPQVKQKNVFQRVFESSDPMQEIVILNTERGFVPAAIRVKEGMQYRIHVVNVNASAKNISFVMDAFSEHHATYYGKIKTFDIHPKREGIYTFVSPETSAQGRVVVHPHKMRRLAPVDIRQPASE